MLKAFLRWDPLSLVAAVLCVAPPTFMLMTIDAGALGDIDWLSLILMFGSTVALFPVLSAPQLAMLFLVRKSQSAGLRALFLVASISMAGIYWSFVRTADLTSTSTAGLAAMFFPLYLGGGSLTAGAAILWTQRHLAGEID